MLLFELVPSFFLLLDQVFDYLLLVGQDITVCVGGLVVSWLYRCLLRRVLLTRWVNDRFKDWPSIGRRVDRDLARLLNLRARILLEVGGLFCLNVDQVLHEFDLEIFYKTLIVLT